MYVILNHIMNIPTVNVHQDITACYSDFCLIMIGTCVQSGAGIAQSVWRLATGWVVRGSNPGGGRNFPHPSRPSLGSTQPPVQGAPGVSRG